MSKKIKEAEEQVDSKIEKLIDDESEGKEEPIDEMVDVYVNLLTEVSYREFFKDMMKRFGIKTLRGLTPAKKSSFFSAVSARWRLHKRL